MDFKPVPRLKKSATKKSAKGHTMVNIPGSSRSTHKSNNIDLSNDDNVWQYKDNDEQHPSCPCSCPCTCDRRGLVRVFGSGALPPLTSYHLRHYEPARPYRRRIEQHQMVISLRL